MATWQALTNYAAQDVVTTVDPNLAAVCVRSGKSGDVEPAWTKIGETISDAAVTWLQVDGLMTLGEIAQLALQWIAANRKQPSMSIRLRGASL